MTKGYERVREVIDSLLAPDGCPWDREQTVESLCDYVLEESFELVEAIRSGNKAEAMEELGDVAFLLLFIGKLYENGGEFTMDEAFHANAAKMIRRHPHVFGDVDFKNQEELLRNWERIKCQEKMEEHRPSGVYDSLPKGLPPLLKAYRIHSKAARTGFTWPDDAAVEVKLHEEWREFQEALGSEDHAHQEREFGDYLFTLVELGRRKGIKANAALHNTNLRFLSRFQTMEALALERGLDIAKLDMAALDQLWEEAKILLAGKSASE